MSTFETTAGRPVDSFLRPARTPREPDSSNPFRGISWTPHWNSSVDISCGAGRIHRPTTREGGWRLGCRLAGRVVMPRLDPSSGLIRAGAIG
ncbi:hypothetical protein Franean1_0385 [Parafrankia sp. EAN1pec]|nr:hypothetical protein Franean1_0385 [Frankia sp. EAN1pec]